MTNHAPLQRQIHSEERPDLHPDSLLSRLKPDGLQGDSHLPGQVVILSPQDFRKRRQDRLDTGIEFLPQ